MDLLHKITLLRNSIATRPATEWVGLANDRLPGLINVLLIVLIAWYSAQLAWALLPQTNDFDWSLRSAAPAAASQPSPQNTGVDYPAIAAAHIFGEAGEAPVIQQEAVTDAPDTSLNLKLRGTIAADDPKVAHAIIADGQGKDDVYFIRDSIPGGATLLEIYPDRVIISRGGSPEALRLPNLSDSLGNQTTASRSAPSRPRQARRPTAPRAQSTTASFMQVFRPQPFMPNGILKGYRVYPGRDRRKFAELGFRPGDLVTSINGQQLDSLQNGPMDIFGEMDSASSMSFTVERSGQPVVLTLDSNQLNSVIEPD